LKNAGNTGTIYAKSIKIYKIFSLKAKELIVYRKLQEAIIVKNSLFLPLYWYLFFILNLSKSGTKLSFNFNSYLVSNLDTNIQDCL